MATFNCGKCARYSALKKPKPSGEGFTALKRGYCLHRTVFAKNRVGNEVYPMGAKVENLPGGNHQIALVHEDELALSCTAGVLRKE